MTKNFLRSALFVFSAAASFAQSTSTLVATGYAEPGPSDVAPGQILTFFYRGIGPAAGGEPRSAKATAPLPTQLAGVSAQIIQGNMLVNVPLLEVRQQNCESALPAGGCVSTQVKAQIPYEIVSDVRQGSEGQVIDSPPARLLLYVDGQPVANSPLRALPDNAHVLTTCDGVWDTRFETACERQVFHVDGSRVSGSAPAAKGETLSLALYGLGKTAPAAPTGLAAEPGHFLTSVLGSPRVRLTFRPWVNAVPSTSRYTYASSPDEVSANISGAALQAGQVGVYQVNFTVPDSVSPPLPCGEGVRSNYLLNVVTSQGTETVPVCIGG